MIIVYYNRSKCYIVRVGFPCASDSNMLRKGG